MHDHRLIPFLAAHLASDLRTLTSAIATAAKAEGLWQIPPEAMDEARRADWPATVVYEVQLYGITAHGGCPRELARNWRHTALNIVAAQLADLTRKDAA